MYYVPAEGELFINKVAKFDKFIFPKFKEGDPDLTVLKKEMNIYHVAVDFIREEMNPYAIYTN
jgi:hypothetical protein